MFDVVVITVVMAADIQFSHRNIVKGESDAPPNGNNPNEYYLSGNLKMVAMVSLKHHFTPATLTYTSALRNMYWAWRIFFMVKKEKKRV